MRKEIERRKKMVRGIFVVEAKVEVEVKITILMVEGQWDFVGKIKMLV
jgi:hypothetical protein